MGRTQRLNVTNDLRLAFEKGVLISTEFEDYGLRTAYVLLGIMDSNESIINNLFYEYGIEISVSGLMKDIAMDRELFESILGPELGDKFYGPADEIIESDEFDKKAKEIVNNENSSISLKDVSDLIDKKLQEEKENKELDEYEPDISIRYSENLVNAFVDAEYRVSNSGEKIIDSDNFVYSLIENPNSSAYRLLEYMLSVINGATMEHVRLYIEQNCEIYSRDEDFTKVIVPSALQSCCEVYNDKFTKGQKSDILGREKEIKQLWNIFSKKIKRNAIITGKPGVGKSALIECMTQDIVNGTCPKRFSGYTVIWFDIEASVAGTKYRGEFEAKVAMLKKFIEKTPKVILVIDEIHRIFGVGSTEGNSDDLSGALKSTLARGDAIVVGTTDCYEKIANHDAAFKRRFEVVNVEEPKLDKVKAMVKLKIKGLQDYHNVKLSDQLLDYIITVSNCFNSEGSNPDKTLDLCDRAMAIAEQANRKKVTKADVSLVFEQNYDMLNKMEKESKEIVAYHEAAHYVVHRMTGCTSSEEIVSVSIIPGSNFLGANISEQRDIVKLYDKDYYLDEICVFLAGRAIEEMKFRRRFSGANNDFQNASNIAKTMVMHYGMLDSTRYGYKGNLSFYISNDKEIFDFDNDLKKELLSKVSEILEQQYKRALDLLNEHEHFLDMIASALLKKNILNKDELDALYSKYLAKK